MAPLVVPVQLGPDVVAALTGRDPAPEDPARGALAPAGNLAHRRPHRPDELAAARGVVARQTGTRVEDWHLMQQVHGADVAVVTAATPPGAELRAVDAAVTREPGRVLAVQTADCVPVLLAGPSTVAVAHAGRAGVVAGVVPAVVRRARELGEDPGRMRAVIGPAIGPCCYEVPAALHDEVVAVEPVAAGTTTWGTWSLDLPAAVTAALAGSGVADITRVGGCTRCEPGHRWFSHRTDPTTGRQLGLVVRREEAA